jgi:glycogen operon protein
VPADADRARQEDKAALADMVGEGGDELTPELVGAVHGFLASAPSELVVAQIEDLAGEIEPVNMPGTDAEYPNWRRRLELDTQAALETENAAAVFAAMKREGR